MKAVVQRVRQTSLSVDGQLISAINGGLVVFLGVKQGDK
ncbi:MAG: D-aminoacyl-tRNA deacylase, partial [Clostridia bacterium]|nr:D-aminoacyl-tRNA deacylase [Clostridia bacterium]